MKKQRMNNSVIICTRSVPMCLTDGLALVPKCLGSEVSVHPLFFNLRSLIIVHHPGASDEKWYTQLNAKNGRRRSAPLYAYL